jgi:hypothetical protein
MPKENSATDQTKNKRYIFAQRQGDDFSCIKILEGQYENIIYKYNKVKISETENENGELPLQFTYDIMANPNDKDINSTDFRNFIGDILIEVMEQQLKEGKLEFDGQ